MIKKFLAVFLIVAAVSSGQAQTVFQKGDIGVNAGIGMGWAYGGYGGVSSVVPVPSFNVSLEVGIFEIPNVGVISVGGFGAFRRTWSNQTYYNYTYTSGVVAARGVFHFQFFDTGGFDLYAGIHTGIRFYNYVYDDIDNFYDYSYNDAVFLDDVFVGARYMMSPKFGFFAELGYGESYLKAGVTLKF